MVNGFDDPEDDPEFEENLRLGLAIPERWRASDPAARAARAWLEHEALKDRRAARPT